MTQKTRGMQALFHLRNVYNTETLSVCFQWTPKQYSD
ncbi:hypothetical protein QE430_002585 [Microbacterium testaceum]|nr:hypothetical protein [Microbacterium testaceum]